jgi:hypothetical protein
MKGSNVWEGGLIGVVNLSEKNFITPVIKTAYNGDLYSPTLITLINDGSFNYGDCGFFVIRIDSDLPENSPTAVESYGYQTVTILNQGKIPRYELKYGLDTSTILLNEVPIVSAYVAPIIEYVAGNLVLEHVVNIPDDWVLSWDMSYNPMMPITEGSNRYYDLYLRAQVSKESNKTTKTDTKFTNVYYLKNFLTSAANAEKSYLGASYTETGSRFTVRINFPLSIDTSTNTIKWSSNQIDNFFYVSSFLSN